MSSHISGRDGFNVESVMSSNYEDEIEVHYEAKLRDIFFQSVPNRQGLIMNE